MHIELTRRQYSAHILHFRHVVQKDTLSSEFELTNYSYFK